MGKPKKKYYAGIDIGGTKLLTAIFDKDLRLLNTEKAKVEVSKGRAYFLDTLTGTLESALKKSGLDLKNLKAVGLGCPGIIQKSEGRVAVSPNLPFLKHFPLAKKLSDRLKTKVVIENDVNAGLYGEFRFGAAKGYKHVIGIFLGTGIGGGVILNGELFYGASGAAGEIGHMNVRENGKLCGCGQRGCLESEAGRIAIASEAAVLAARQKARNLYKLAGTEVSKIKSGVLAKAIAHGDRAIEELIIEKSKLLGRAMAGIANLLSPELFVLGGGLVEALGKTIVGTARDAMHDYAMPDVVRPIKVVPAKLKDYAGVIGAACLAAEQAD